MATKFAEYNQGEATTDQVWQNSLAYLQLLQEQDVQINLQLANGNLEQAAQHERQLLILLERLIKQKEENGRSKELNELLPRIRTLQKELAKTRNGSFASETKKERARKEYEELEDIYLILGNLMYKLDLIFKQGIDIDTIWSQG